MRKPKKPKKKNRMSETKTNIINSKAKPKDYLFLVEMEVG